MNRILLYVKDVERSVAFYTEHFGFRRIASDKGDRIVELLHDGSGMRLMFHRAGKAQESGQSVVKLVFDIAVVENFRVTAEGKGLKFGAVHKADGYVFSNAKDPDGNPVSISSRAFRQP